jgi:hypothetical protein
MTEDEKLLIEAIKSDALWINNALFVGISLCIATIMLKCIAKKEDKAKEGSGQLEILNIKIDRQYFWLVVLAMTLAHLYCANLFIRDGYRLFNSSYEARRTAFYELSISGPPFFKGLIPRLWDGTNFPPIYGYDPTGWLAHVSALAILLSVIRWRGITWPKRITSIFLALVLTYANWVIGTNWSLAASELILPNRGDSHFYRRLHPEFGSTSSFPLDDSTSKDPIH